MEAERAFPDGPRGAGRRGARAARGAGRQALGDADDPLLVSVRSGARESMPGMLDTVLNLGLNDESVEGLARRPATSASPGTPTAASCRCSATSAAASPASATRTRSRSASEAGVKLDTELDVDDLQGADGRASRSSSPTRPARSSRRTRRSSCTQAIRAVFDSWIGRARGRATGASTASPTSGAPRSTCSRWCSATRATRRARASPSRATRSPARPSPSGDFLRQRPGRGRRLGRAHAARHRRAGGGDARGPRRADGDPAHARAPLPRHAGHRVHGRGGHASTCSRRATPSARRRPRCASRSTRSRRACSTREEALADDRRRQARRAAAPDLRPATPTSTCSREGVAASPGRRQGRDRVHRRRGGRGGRGGARRDPRAARSPRPTTWPASTPRRASSPREGGKASHAALVARGMGKPCVCGRRRARDRPRRARRCSVDGTAARRGRPDRDRRHGRHRHRRRRAARGARGSTTHFETVLGWADELRTLGVRANADTPEDARQGARVRRRGHRPVPHRAHVHGRRPPAEDAGDDHGRRPRRSAARRSTSCCRSSRRTSRACSRQMAGLPVTIRLLDPPLHEFLPRGRGRWRRRSSAPASRSRTTSRSSSTRSTASTRWRRPTRCSARAACRLGVLHPEIYEMQVRAIVRAARCASARARAAARDHDPAGRLRAGARADARAGRAGRSRRRAAASSTCTIGTMIELPRACFVADRIAEHADFFSFGTNDLTQTALGFSRDDVEGALPRRATSSARSLDRSPFETIDEPGVGWLVRLAAWVGPRGASPDLKLGICGEHGGDPDSIAFFQLAGLDYVSCSPYRVPIARVAAAQAALSEPAARHRAWPAHPSASGSSAPRRRVTHPLAAPSYPARRQREEPDSDHRTPVPARPRPDRPLQDLPAAEAQDAGLHRPRGRPLPHAAHAHARGLRDLAHRRAGAAAQRGPHRGDRARARPRPPALRPRRRGGARRVRCRSASGARFRHNEHSLRVVEGSSCDAASTSPSRCATASCTTPGRSRRRRSRGGSCGWSTGSPTSTTTSTTPCAPACSASSDLPRERDRVLGDDRLRAHRHARARPGRAAPSEAGDIVQGEEVGGAMVRLRKFMFERVYLGRRRSASSSASSACCGRCSTTTCEHPPPALTAGRHRASSA